MADFDVDEFLARPLVARVATNGPTIRPIWFLCFDAERAVLKLSRYLGTDTARWDDERFGRAPSTVAGSDQRSFIRLAPTRMTARDLSFAPVRKAVAVE